MAFDQATSIVVDPNLDRAVRLELNKPDGDLTASDMLSLTNLSAPNCGILSLAGLEKALHLQALDWAVNNLTNIAPLANLPELFDLDLCFSPIVDYSPLATLPRLSKLDLLRSII